MFRYLQKYSETILIGYVGQSITGSANDCISSVTFPVLGHFDIQMFPHDINQLYGITEYLFSFSKNPTTHCTIIHIYTIMCTIKMLNKLTVPSYLQKNID